jgi:hypothetical protein
MAILLVIYVLVIHLRADGVESFQRYETVSFQGLRQTSRPASLGGEAADKVRRAEYNKHGRSSSDTGKSIKGRCSLLKDTANQTPKRLLKLAEVVNARLEGLHNKIRLLSHRSYGFHSPQALIALIYLC